ncbi:hypothetical protein EFY87_07585 [Flexivirga caeni]|uniref:ESX secretion-associated protein EspG n=1 Tax=Flexivirga caeni TaxID=2294115 RepID=A0A3M9MF59_9MICO|nr:hypothetical protein EFY87_07585 [Flexivirga caeni]
MTPLVQFTDEELLLLGAEHPVVDAPYLNTLQPAERALAARVAYRSLCSHGAIAVDDGSGLELPESHVTMLQLRAAATTVLVVSRATMCDGVMRYHHLGADRMVVEDVSDAGAHEFRLVPQHALAATLRQFCAVDGAADGHGPPVTVTEAGFATGDAAAELWGEGLAQFDATVWRADPSHTAPAPVLGYLLGTGGSWRVDRDGLAGGAAATVRLTAVGAAEVADSILHTLLTDPAGASTVGEGAEAQPDANGI